ncbi:MAG TPA: hypothetical protein VH186_33140 [Chloroflexia bacterium]|nr:hypothetical protein [Chloroflexia bacterium]
MNLLLAHSQEQAGAKNSLYINRELIARNNYEQQIWELQEPYIKLGELVSDWYKAFQAGHLKKVELELAQGVLNTLMLLPPRIRQELCGGDIEKFQQELAQR